MRILIFSDVHGDDEAAAQLLFQADRLAVDQLFLLGDVLHPGRAVATAALLNRRRADITAVCGNCDDPDFDQERLDFSLDRAFVSCECGGRHFLLCHGHDRPFDQSWFTPGTILAQGHTHIPEISALAGGVVRFNPGSIARPRGGFPPTFGLYAENKLSIRRLPDGDVLAEYQLPDLT